MTQTSKLCALAECDQIIEPQPDGNPARKYCSAEHSSAARRRRLQARANRQQAAADRFDDLEDDSGNAAVGGANRTPPTVRRRVGLRFPSRRTGIALGAVVAAMVLGPAAFEIQQAARTEQAAGTPAATTARSPSSAPPGAPSGLTASTGNGQAVLCWDAAADATAYHVYSRDVTASEAWVRYASAITDGSCWTARPLVNGDKYEFRVTSSNLSGESGFSNIAESAPPGARAPAR